MERKKSKGKTDLEEEDEYEKAGVVGTQVTNKCVQYF